MRFIVLAIVTLMTFISPASGTGFEQAVERYKAKEFQIAFAEFYELATDEHASAQVNLAIMFAKGQGVPQNDAHALYWAWRARFSGASQAIPIIDYLTHKTIEADRIEIAKNLRFSYAARFESGDETAALKMARTFNEVDKPRDPNLAYKWFTVAAAMDVQYAMALRETLALEILPEDRSRLQKDATPSPEEATHQSQLRTMLRKAISKLPEREALVLQFYYVEELNVYEVAAILDVTTGRVSQIKRAAIERAHSLIMEQME